jgi:GT2 family glycosyltransferase
MVKDDIDFINIVMPSYNRIDILKQSLAALFNQSIPAERYQVILVDDASTDGTDVYVQNILPLYPNLRYIKHEINKGLASARNSGINEVTAGLVLFLDSDIVADKCLLERHIQTHHHYKQDRVAVISNVLYPKEYIEHSNFSKFIQSRELGSRPVSERTRLDYTDLPSRYFAGGASSVHIDDIKQIGFFDSSFKTYGGEDEEFGWRLKKAGVRIVFCENALVYHHDEASFQRYKRKLIETASGSYKIIINKEIFQLKDSNINSLLPIDLHNDSFKIITFKIFLKLILNPILIKLIELYVSATDKIGFFYSTTLFRILCAGWVSIGLKSTHDDKSRVW